MVFNIIWFNVILPTAWKGLMFTSLTLPVMQFGQLTVRGVVVDRDIVPR